MAKSYYKADGSFDYEAYAADQKKQSGVSSTSTTTTNKTGQSLPTANPGALLGVNVGQTQKDYADIFQLKNSTASAINPTGQATPTTSSTQPGLNKTIGMPTQTTTANTSNKSSGTTAKKSGGGTGSGSASVPAASETAAAPAAVSNTNAQYEQQIQQLQQQLDALQASQPTRGEQAEYTPSAEVQAIQQQLNQLQANQPGAYTPSENVMAALQTLNDIQTNKPQGYTSKYADQMNNILQQITNPEQFKWSFNGDELFKMYADEYTQRGKQAAQDVMGQAAALTGGYGNSYAQAAANQAYDQYLTQLYDRGFDLRDRAYEMWKDQQNSKYDQYNLLANADQTDYGRYRDTVGDWENERGYWTDWYNNQSNTDYNRYRDTVSDWMNNRDYYTNQYNTLSNQDYSRYADARDFAEQQYQYDRNLQENIRQFNESLNWEKMSADQKYAAEYAMQILANGQMPSEQMLMAAGLSAEDAQKMMAQIAASGGSSGGGKSSGNQDVIYNELTNGQRKYYTLEYDANDKQVKKNYIDGTQVSNNDMVRDMYEEGGQRRASNQNGSVKIGDKYYTQREYQDMLKKAGLSK